jgi:ATP-dependent RNA helicase DeaD
VSGGLFDLKDDMNQFDNAPADNASMTGVSHSTQQHGASHAEGHQSGSEASGRGEHGGPDANAPASDTIFDKSRTFADLGLDPMILKGLDELEFVHPTKIQSLLIPPMLSGKDMLGQARTGTGKTGAFGLPILHRLIHGDQKTPFAALVMVPTRELCVQVAQELSDLGQATPIRTLAVYGGERMAKQIDSLKRGPQIVVSTPGRLMDMLDRGHLHLRNVKFAVLDEVDRMLDIGFRDDIRQILNDCPKERQTVFVSATISRDIEKLARNFTRPDAEKVIAIDKGAATTTTVKQYYLPVNPWDKPRLLAHLVQHEEPAMTIVFCRMKSTVDKVSLYLREKGIDAQGMHGDKSQSKRNSLIQKMHRGELRVIVASDLVARGIDVQGISHVINYDLPEDPEVYVHRVGRTARIGREGVAYSFVTREDGELLTQVEVLINAEIPRLIYPDFKPTDKREQFGGGGGGGRGQGGYGGGQGGPGGPGGSDAPQAPAKQFVNRMAATMNPTMPVQQKSPGSPHPSQNKFPGGVVPSQLPPKRMMGRMKTSKGLRESGS